MINGATERLDFERIKSLSALFLYLVTPAGEQFIFYTSRRIFHITLIPFSLLEPMLLRWQKESPILEKTLTVS